MLHILLLILKILLFVVLGLLGLALFLILVVLIAPIKYKLSVVKNDNITATARIRFLIIAIKVYFDKDKNKLDILPSILGIKFPMRKKKDNLMDEAVKSDALEDYDVPEDINKEINTEEYEDINTKEEANLKIDENQYNEDNDENNAGNEDISINTNDDEHIEENVKKGKKGIFGKIKDKLLGITKKISMLSPEKISNTIEKKSSVLEQKIDLIKKFWNFDCTVKSRKYLKKYIISVIKHISPKKIKGYVRYGFGDPCKTGQVTGYLSLIPCVYQKNFSLQPDFYNKILECDVEARGRIRLGYIVRIVLNLNIWKTLRLLKKLSNKIKAVK